MAYYCKECGQLLGAGSVYKDSLGLSHHAGINPRTGKRCGGFVSTDPQKNLDNARNAGFFSSFGKAKPEGETKKEGKGDGWQFNNIEAWIKAILTTAILIFLIVSNPLLSGFQSAVNNLLPDGVDGYGLIWGIIAILLFFYFMYVIRSNSIWLGIAVIMILTILTMVWPMLSTLPQVKSAVCMIVNPANAEKCMSSVTGDEPPAVQIEPTAVANVRFDTKSYGMTVFGDQSSLKLGLYAMPLIVSNPSETKSVRNFYIKTATLWNNTVLSGKGAGKVNLSDLVPDKCQNLPETNPLGRCTIGPGDSITVNLRGSGSVPYDPLASDQAQVRVTYSYEYVGEGHNNLIFAANWTDYEEAKRMSGGATKYGGPVGVVVYFVPDSVIATSQTMYSDPELSVVAVQVSLSNIDENGYALLQSPINITTYFTGNDHFIRDDQNRPWSCTFSWSDTPVAPMRAETGSTYENDKLEFESDTMLSKKQLISCTYPYSLTADYLNFPKVVKFVARVDYQYMENIAKSGITIQRNGLVGSSTTTTIQAGVTTTTLESSSTTTTTTTLTPPIDSGDAV